MIRPQWAMGAAAGRARVRLRWRPIALSRRHLLIALVIFGALLRGGRLAWQPLWADEGYSIYFATEPVGRMLALTAHDIHPPLYYALLHGWIAIVGSANPLYLRLFSLLLALPALILCGFLADAFFPARRRVALIALTLLLWNPLALYYSQEIRMYGLAMTLSMAATLCCWQWLQRVEAGQRAGRWLGAYVVVAILALYTLYYLGFLLLSHSLWVVWRLRRRLPVLWHWLGAEVMVALLYLPWLLYTATALRAYVASKVQSDQDAPLGLFTYVGRHLLAFTAGHQPLPAPWDFLRGSGLAALLLLSVVAGVRWYGARSKHATLGGRHSMILRSDNELLDSEDRKGTLAAHYSIWSSRAYQALWLFLGVPLLIGYGVNLRYPFFPEGGERLLLFVLPYFLLLVAAAIDAIWQQWLVAWVALAALLVSAVLGVWTFYTQPRYQADDYRPVVQQVVQQGADGDTLLATFPWQVGFWRAYAPLLGLTAAHGPHVQLISDGAALWGPAVQHMIDDALRQGTLWAPALLTIGSDLPAQLEHYLQPRAINFENRWVSATTRLYAWRAMPPAALQPEAQSWAGVHLVGAGLSATTLVAANGPLMVSLAWQLSADAQTYGVTLRLVRDEHTWAHRDYSPVGALAQGASGAEPVDQVGLLAPPGLPPGEYTLQLGLVNADDALIAPIAAKPAQFLVPLGTVVVTAPDTVVPAFRLPMQHALAKANTADALQLLGYSSDRGPLLAGDQIAVSLFWRAQSTPATARQLYVSLVDRHGQGVAGWEGWPLPDYPVTAWGAGALVQTPVRVQLAATIPTGDYQLQAGLIDAAGQKGPATPVGALRVVQRQASFTLSTPPQHPLPEPVQFGAHVELIGYATTLVEGRLTVTLTWHVLQTLLPPHHIFLHVRNEAGDLVAQQDTPPLTTAGPAPTGSWQPGEYLITTHELALPAVPLTTLQLQVGLYVPATGVRLPASAGGAPVGDVATLALQP
ncbi:MAG: hypothetical protein R3C14_37605 [Caldilineaceae bacterium]